MFSVVKLAPGFVSTVEAVTFFKALLVEEVCSTLAAVAMIAAHYQGVLMVCLLDKFLHIAVINEYGPRNVARDERLGISDIHKRQRAIVIADPRFELLAAKVLKRHERRQLAVVVGEV